MKTLQKIFLVFTAIIGLVCFGFVVWGYTPAQAMIETKTVLQSNSQVFVEEGKWLVFTPKNEKVSTGYIFYPGGRVDYRAYAPYANAIAEVGYLVVIPRMPLNLAVFGINSAEKIIKAYPDVEHWVIGGHSLGGSMAASYLYEHQNQIDGLIFLASYPAESNDLSNYGGKVMTISASLDGLTTPEKIEASLLLLPEQTISVVIEGGNHAYFGWYGDQNGDNIATITREEEQAITQQNSLDLLDQVNR